MLTFLRSALPVWLRQAQWERLLDRAALLVGVGCLIASFGAHVKMMAYPGPQEINEPATWYATRLLAEGRNPFYPHELPGSAQFFGPFYNYVVIALSPVVGTSYFGHRLLNFLCIAAALGVLGGFMRRSGAGWGLVVASLSVLYWIILDNIMITARPDALGWLFFLVALFLPAVRRFSLGASVAGLACAVIAFQCKAYFALAGPAILLGQAIWGSRREALWSTVGFGSAVLISIAVTTWFFPLYFLEVFVMQRSMVAGNSSDHMSAVHTALFVERAWPFVLIAAAGGGHWLAGPARTRWREWRAGRVAGRAALAPASVAELFVGLLLAHAALVYFYMGRNGGAWFTYHLQLVLPLLLVATALAAGRAAWLRVGATVLVAIFAVTSLQVRWSPTDSTPYQRMVDLIRTEPGEVFALAAAVEPLADHKKKVYDDGFTNFLGFALVDELPERFFAARLVEERCNERDEELADKVTRRAFALILTEEDKSFACPIELIKTHYRVVETFQMPTYFGHGPVWAWRPKRPGE